MGEREDPGRLPRQPGAEPGPPTLDVPELERAEFTNRHHRGSGQERPVSFGLRRLRPSFVQLDESVSHHLRRSAFAAERPLERLVAAKEERLCLGEPLQQGEAPTELALQERHAPGTDPRCSIQEVQRLTKERFGFARPPGLQNATAPAFQKTGESFHGFPERRVLRLC